MEKTFERAVMKMGDSAVEQVEVIPSGSVGLDLALGVGGYPRGRVVGASRPRIFRQDHFGYSCHSGSAKKRAALRR